MCGRLQFLSQPTHQANIVIRFLFPQHSVHAKVRHLFSQYIYQTDETVPHYPWNMFRRIALKTMDCAFPLAMRNLARMEYCSDS